VAAAKPSRVADRSAVDTGRVGALIALVASAAGAAFVLAGGDAWRVASTQTHEFLTFVGLAVALQLAAVEVYGRGALSFSGMGMLAAGFALGPGAAMVAAIGVAVVNLVHQRGRLERAAFNAATLSLSSFAGAGVYHALGADAWSVTARVVPAFAGGVLFMIVNLGLVSLAMSLSEQLSIRSVWRERFRWFTPYYLVSGPLALATTVAFEKADLVGLVAFALAPAIMMFSIRQYVNRTRESVEEVRRANEELRVSNAQLAARNADLQELFDFAGGLAARNHDGHELIAYAERQLGRLTGVPARLAPGSERFGIPLISGGHRVATLELPETVSFDRERWERLRDAVLPQLATALESSELIQEVRKQHLATIAALSRSIEAKDGSTGEHTERVSALAVELARRLGYSGTDLDAIEVGALLHDIGKIGVPEAILHKPGPLDDEEWEVMKRHPLVSEHILSGVGVSPIVLQIARSSHERFDGTGYPDRLAGERIPLPARIVLVADAFDAITSDRPYRTGRPGPAALEEVRANAGTQFCPRVVEALEEIFAAQPQLLGDGHLRAVERVA
jgi:putative nucleotidyltransferase with HDIG domain